MSIIRQCDYCHKAIEPSEYVGDRPISVWSTVGEDPLWDFHPTCFQNVYVWLGLKFDDKNRGG